MKILSCNIFRLGFFVFAFRKTELFWNHFFLFRTPNWFGGFQSLHCFHREFFPFFPFLFCSYCISVLQVYSSFLPFRNIGFGDLKDYIHSAQLKSKLSSLAALLYNVEERNESSVFKTLFFFYKNEICSDEDHYESLACNLLVTQTCTYT